MPLLPSFKRTLFLDTDIELLSLKDDIFEMPKVLTLFDLRPPSDGVTEKRFVPEGFTEINSGVMGIRRSFRQRSLTDTASFMIVLVSILITTLWRITVVGCKSPQFGYGFPPNIICVPLSLG